MNNKVLVIGSGGREHALAWKLSLSSTVEEVFVAPGNPGTASENKVSNIDINANEHDELIAFCQQSSIDLVVVGPEQPLCEGLVDKMTEAGVRCFGPSAAAAELEGSKAYSKAFLKKYDIQTAAYETFTEIEAAHEYLLNQSYPLVIKADGLAAGKGVVIAEDEQQARDAISDMLSGNVFGEAGHRIIIEEFLQGEEASFIVIVDGENFLPMATSQDHKARDEGDKGPNTGGMGAYSPAPIVNDKVYQDIIETVIKPTIQGMRDEGRPFVGFLYAGLMIDQQGRSKVLEFNVRFGDPETQPIMMRLNSNLDVLCLAAIEGSIDQHVIEWDKRACLGVVLAEKGYPESYNTGSQISGLQQLEGRNDVKAFHAGTKYDNGLKTSGGRVLCVCALADDVAQAQKLAYSSVELVHWPSLYMRKDIGYKAF